MKQRKGKQEGTANFEYFDLGTFNDDPEAPPEALKDDMDKCIVWFKQKGYAGIALSNLSRRIN